MKKLVLLTMILLCAFTYDSTAQRKRKRTATTQGNWVLRLGMGFNSDRNTDDVSGFETTNNSFNFNPALSYMVIDNLEVGVRVGVANNSMRQELTANSRNESDQTNVTFGLFAQKYFPMNNWFAFYTNANIGFLTGSGETSNIVGATNNSSGFVNNGVEGSVNLGFMFTPHNAVGLYTDFAGIGLSNVKRNPDGNVLPSTSRTSAGFNVARNPLNFGVAWFFGRGLWNK